MKEQEIESTYPMRHAKAETKNHDIIKMYECRVQAYRKQAALLYHPSESIPDLNQSELEKGKDLMERMAGPLFENGRVILVWSIILGIIILVVLDAITSGIVHIGFTIMKWAVIVLGLTYLMKRSIQKMKYRWRRLKAWVETPIEEDMISTKQESTKKVRKRV